MKQLILALGIAANASASVVVKTAMTPPKRFPPLADPLATLSNWFLWLGFCLYSKAFLLYAAGVAKVPLNVANPAPTSGAVATVALSSVF